MNPLDTTPDARRIQEEAQERLGPGGRLRIAIELSESVRRIRFDGLRSEHPGCSDAELVHKFVREVHGIRPWWT